MTHPEDTAIIERDLSAIEDALAGGGVAHDEPAARELQELALALRADAPAPDADFAQELDRRLKAGFPRDFRSRSRQLGALERLAAKRGRMRRLPNLDLADVAAVAAPVLLIAALVVAAATGALQGGGGDDDAAGGGGGSVAELREGGGSDGGGGGSVDESAGAGSEEAAPGTSARRVESAPGAIPRPRDGFAPNRSVRRIERSISMTLSAPDDEVPEVADGVNRVTARNGGFVLRSELDTSEDGSAGSFELRIPTNRLQAALRGLAQLATVSSLNQSGRDITRGFVTAQDRLRAALAERRSLLRRLERAVTDAEAEALRVKLDLVAREINGLRGRLRGLRLRTDYATVSVDLAGGAGDSGAGSGAGAFDDAVADAGDLLVGFAGVLIRVLAIALPLGLIALVAWAAGAGLRRRRRESALA